MLRENRMVERIQIEMNDHFDKGGSVGVFLLVNPFGKEMVAKTTGLAASQHLLDQIMDHMGQCVKSPPLAQTRNKEKEPAQEPAEEVDVEPAVELDVESAEELDVEQADEVPELHPKRERKTPKKILQKIYEHVL